MNPAKSVAWFGVVVALSAVAAGVRLRKAAVELVVDLADASDGPDLPGDLDDWDTPQAPFTMRHGTAQFPARVGDALTRGNINALPCGSIVKRFGHGGRGAPLAYDRHGFTSVNGVRYHRDKVIGWGDATIESLGGNT